jgi:hypothetical protein
VLGAFVRFCGYAETTGATRKNIREGGIEMKARMALAALLSLTLILLNNLYAHSGSLRAPENTSAVINSVGTGTSSLPAVRERDSSRAHVTLNVAEAREPSAGSCAQRQLLSLRSSSTSEVFLGALKLAVATDPCDADGDGYTSVDCGGTDCDDFSEFIHPGAQEVCSDGVDNDCDGDVDMSDRHSACDERGWFWMADDCLCSAATPIIIDTRGNGVDLTNAQGGVDFDINNDGHADRLSWTQAGGDDAFLALDRNGNGVVDSGIELFGNFTPQPFTSSPNGFLALAEYDHLAQGGNGDRVIDNRDTVFNGLRLWQDLNHNGISEPGELRSLAASSISSIELDYRESQRQDRYGNTFRYRAKLSSLDKQSGKWAWDVILLTR